jgi:hypothetical protein
MKPARLKRPTTHLERTWLWLLFAALMVSGTIAGTRFMFSWVSVLAASRGEMFALIIGLGILTILLIGITFFYSLRKRVLQERAPGSMMAWLHSHVYIGLISLGVALMHVWVPSFSASWSTGKVTLIVFALLVISGVAWRIVYAMIPPRVANEVGNLSMADTQDKVQIVRIEVDKILAGKSAEFRHSAHGRLNGLSLGDGESEHTLRLEELADWKRFNRLADRLDYYARREVRQKAHARFLQGWKQLHLPLAAILVALIGVHAWDALRITHVLTGSELSGLPPATACASCHSEIADEWKLAMHAQAQTGPIVIAQTNLALERFPEFGRACNNCHSPIGTALTDTSTLPLDEKNTLRSLPNGAVVDDGITCIVCHTLPRAPGEGRGTFDDFPVAQGNANQFADIYGPSLGAPPPLPNTRHNSGGVGFMTDSLSASQACGACHNVKVDIDGDGQLTAFPGSEGADLDTDGDGQLDENELEFAENGTALQDLVLQTTFDEWQDYVAAQRSRGVTALGCVDCHMPAQNPGPIVDSAPGSFLGPAPARPSHSHTFVGVDYNLAPGFYEQAGFPPNARQLVLKEREAFLQSAASLAVSASEPADDELSVIVTVESNFAGHGLPTGFAFVRQMWLEVSAQTASGRQVCLADVEVNGQVIQANCTSGSLDSPQDDLATCDPLELASLGLKPSKNDELVQLDPASVAPLSGCDPWLANFQKILTDGDLDGDEVFTEVPYQSLLADIVKTRVRVSDQQAMDALNPTLIVNDEPKGSATFEYIFNVNELQGEDVIVTVDLHFRHLPPYFIHALDGRYPDGLTAKDLLQNLTTVTMATAQSDLVRVP